jgi:hypothetical protein
MNAVLHNLTVYEHYSAQSHSLRTLLCTISPLTNTALHNLPNYKHCSAQSHHLQTLLCTVSPFTNTVLYNLTFSAPKFRSKFEFKELLQKA